MSTPTTLPTACRVLAEAVSLSRSEAQRDLGPQMLDGLVSQGLARHKDGRYACTEAGQRAARVSSHSETRCDG